MVHHAMAEMFENKIVVLEKRNTSLRSRIKKLEQDNARLKQVAQDNLNWYNALKDDHARLRDLVNCWAEKGHADWCCGTGAMCCCGHRQVPEEIRKAEKEEVDV
jgi:hypothetical protein